MLDPWGFAAAGLQPAGKMITLRRAVERRCDRLRGGETWLVFDILNRSDPFADGFGMLGLLNEERLPPGGATRFSAPEASEVLTYVHEGKLAYENSMGGWSVLQAGDFQR